MPRYGLINTYNSGFLWEYLSFISFFLFVLQIPSTQYIYVFYALKIDSFKRQKESQLHCKKHSRIQNLTCIIE